MTRWGLEYISECCWPRDPKSALVAACHHRPGRPGSSDFLFIFLSTHVVVSGIRCWAQQMYRLCGRSARP